MKQRIPGRTGRAVSEIGLGTWQLGTRWGDPFDREGAAFDKGETFSGVPYGLAGRRGRAPADFRVTSFLIRKG